VFLVAGVLKVVKQTT